VGLWNQRYVRFCLYNKISSVLLGVALSISSKTLCRVCRQCFTFNLV